VEFLLGHLLDQVVPEDASIVHEHVEAAENA
jgi:hypothetical protein